ncbi:MAG: hypothetical protein K0S61_4565 [Anaerocolumna sp.]|jgi:hypothetical protein|nr:hypothetical protein [Anaerocolumna sp.]
MLLKEKNIRIFLIVYNPYAILKSARLSPIENTGTFEIYKDIIYSLYGNSLVIQPFKTSNT